MANQKSLLFFLTSFFLIGYNHLMGKEIIQVGVGVVLDLNSTVGEMADRCISMAISDFYAEHADYRTRIVPFTMDSRDDVVTAASAVFDLMKNKGVAAIIGPEYSSQAKFFIDLGGKVNVPIISFSATSPFLSPAQSQYFIRTAQDDSFQVQAIAAIVQAFGWREIVPIYEDTEYGNGLVPRLLHEFQGIDTRVPYSSSISLTSNNSEIMEELKKLKNMQKFIFLVHMTARLGSRLFILADKAGMMSEGYAWVVTEGLSNLLDPVGVQAMHSMQGVLGIRPFIPSSNELKIFKSKWVNSFSLKKPRRKGTKLSLFGLWAYDTVRALAIAVEKAGIADSNFLKQNDIQSIADLEALPISEIGPKLLDSIESTRFQGLSGEFQLVNKQLMPSPFEVFNVIGDTERVIGYWALGKGLSRNLDNKGKIAYSTSKNTLKQPIWPGDTTEQPKKMRIGVPVHNKNGFNEFVNVEWRSPKSIEPVVSGFCPDVFRAVVEKLPFPLPYQFVPRFYQNRESAGTHNEHLQAIKNGILDAVVGDITIVADRLSYVDFTLPYSESGVSMLVLMKHDDERESIWIFLKPLSLDLWFTTVAGFILTALVVWVLEHRTNTEFGGSPNQQIGTIFWFSFSTLVFAHREKLSSNWTKLVVFIWIFVVLIISQSYTAGLASILTVQRMKPTVVDIKEIKENGYFVGHLTNSFVRELLINHLHFNETMLRNYSTAEDYYEALSAGTVAAIFDEIPYIKSFLAKYCSNKFKMVGPTYRTDGFAFAFPIGSPLVPYISRAILDVTEDKDKMDEIERKNFGSRASTCEEQDSLTIPDSLSSYSFGGLFIILVIASISALLINLVKFFYLHWPESTGEEASAQMKFLKLAKHFFQKDMSAHPFKRSESTVHLAMSPQHIGASHDDNIVEEDVIGDDVQSNSSTSHEVVEDVVRDDNPASTAINATTSTAPINYI